MIKNRAHQAFLWRLKAAFELYFVFLILNPDFLATDLKSNRQKIKWASFLNTSRLLPKMWLYSVLLYFVSCWNHWIWDYYYWSWKHFTLTLIDEVLLSVTTYDVPNVLKTPKCNRQFNNRSFLLPSVQHLLYRTF